MRAALNKTLKEIAELLGGELIGDGNIKIRGMTGIEKAEEGDLVFARDLHYLKKAEETKAAAIIVAKEIEKSSKPLIRVENPDLAFARLLKISIPPKKIAPTIDKRAFIAKNVRIGKGVAISAYTVVEQGAEIGPNTIIHPQVYIGKGVKIGEEVCIYPQVSIREGTVIGNRVIIHNGTVIGSDGFGYVRDKHGYFKVPQLGGVLIGDEVEIGANVTIDRATLGQTVIKKGTKIDNLVQIAHNVTIGENSMIVAQVGISGSVEIGDEVILAGQVGVSDHVSIGSHTKVGGKSGVTKNIPAHSHVSGFPAQPHKEQLKIKAVLQKLPQIANLVHILEQKIKKIGKIVGGTGIR